MMVYRRKALPVSNCTVKRYRTKLCNAYAHSLPFQAHNALALQEQMIASDAELCAKLNERASAQQFIPARLLKQTIKNAKATRFTLPLPDHFISPEDSKDNFEPRKFCHLSAIEDVVLDSVYSPRCALTGLFFTREEMVDNLQAAALELQFTSPFWLRSDHPALQSKFLKAKDDCEPIVVSLMASVVSVENVDLNDTCPLHHSLQSFSSRRKSLEFLKFDNSIPRGMNAITGFTCRNKFVQNMPQHGLWISLDQLIQHGMNLIKSAKNLADVYTLVEIDQWELYNADQLVTPGRLALRQSVSKSDEVSLFQSL